MADDNAIKSGENPFFKSKTAGQNWQVGLLPQISKELRKRKVKNFQRDWSAEMPRMVGREKWEEKKAGRLPILAASYAGFFP